MIIDFHTHYYTGGRPDSAVEYLKENEFVLDGENGELNGLLSFMDDDEVDISINAPIATSAKECLAINRLMIANNKLEKKVISLGTIFPEMAADDSAAEELHFLAQNGIKGIKLHPQEQDFLPDEEYMKSVYQTCIDEGLFVLMHAGADAEPDVDVENINGRPYNIKNVMDTYPDLVLIAAHMGGLQMWDEAEKYLLGKNIYFDTSYCTIMPDELFKHFVKMHGADKVLFGTDFPWVRAEAIIEKVKKNVKDSSLLEQIMYKNAKALLNI